MKNKRLMQVVLVCALMLAAGCTSQSKESSSSESLVPSSSVSSSEEASSSAPDSSSGDATTVVALDLTADGSEVFRGTVDDFAVNDAGKTVWVMRAENAKEGDALVNVVVDEETQFSFDATQVANGASLEIAYTPAADGTVPTDITAKAVNSLNSVMPLILYAGEIVEITPDAEKPGSGSILLKPMPGAEGSEWQFNYSPDTKFSLDKGLEGLKVGEQVDVLYDGISTRSIPPQSFAQEVLLHNMPATVK